MTLDFPNLEIAFENASQLDPNEFTQIRRSGIGASDASVILGLQNKWKTIDDIIAEKKQKHLSQVEIEIGRKPSVRKGRDLEPLVLRKAEEFFKQEIVKPTDMYRFKDTPWLTVNFDGIIVDHTPVQTVVEAKVVTPYGEKFYDKSKAVKNKSDIDLCKLTRCKQSFLQQDIETKAKICGIPPYYYAQVQQQLMALSAPYGYLAALHDKEWELKIYFIPADEALQFKIVRDSKKVWNKIKGVED